MTLEPGSRLGPYELLASIGAGGMGEVYRARDTRLGRLVAVKVVLPDVEVSDAQRERFAREAKVISQLNHPHICILHDVGRQNDIDFLVMEYLDGETLAERLMKGPLPVPEVLRYASQIAEALDKAHRRGVVHRDLKPGNVMLTKEGVKLLDFGLAKLRESDAALGTELSRFTTPGKPLTAEGALLGTLSYMAPEQLEGKDADARTDVFALGAVLYEMLTGRRAFEGKTPASLIAAILEREPPPLSELLPLTPPLVDRIVKTCLAKDPDRRLQSAADVARGIEWVPDAATSYAAAGPGPWSRRAGRWAPYALALLIAGVAFLWRASLPPSRPTTRLSIDLPPEHRVRLAPSDSVAMSPDGRTIAYAALGPGGSKLYLRGMSQFDAKPVATTGGASSMLSGAFLAGTPFFSPDGRWVGFVAKGKLQKVSIDGGAPIPICDLPQGLPYLQGASWGAHDTIVFVPSFASGLWSVSASGGTAKEVVAPDRKESEAGYGWPQILPDGETVLVTLAMMEGTRVVLVSLETGDKRVVLDESSGATNALYVPGGYLAYARSGSLVVAPVDLERAAIIGDGVSLIDDLYMYPFAPPLGYFAVASSGALLYAPNVGAPASGGLAWIDRHQNKTKIADGAGLVFRNPSLSPDGRRLAIVIDSEEGRADIWIYDVERSTRTRLTFEGQNISPIWTPDGRRITFASSREGAMSLYWKPSDGSGEAERLLARDGLQFPGSWSPDERLLAFTDVSPETGTDIWTLSKDGEASPFLVSPFNQHTPKLSPDGRFLAYVSDETGREEVYLTPFPAPLGKIEISTAGGWDPVWARDGREIFYESVKGLMAVAVKVTDALTPEPPRLLFSSPFRFDYDVSPDGQRFVQVETPRESAPRKLRVVLNWVEEIDQRFTSE